MPKFIDLTGKTYGRLTVLGIHSRLGSKGGTRYLCKCQCGTEKPILAAALSCGLTLSCGCLNKDVLRARRVDHTGTTFGRWTAIRYTGSDQWLFRCSCGTERTLRTALVTCGHSKSCGCLKNEVASKTHTKHGKSTSKKRTRDASYTTWCSMKQRCFNPNTKQFDDYGGRGITVCDRWKDSFSNFVNDMGERPPGLTLERKNNNGNYEPDNCEWASRLDQGKNRRPQVTEIFLIHDGQRHNLTQWSAITGLGRSVIYNRLSRGWPIHRVLGSPTRIVECKGVTLPIDKWSIIRGIPADTIACDLDIGKTPEEALRFTAGR